MIFDNGYLSPEQIQQTHRDIQVLVEEGRVEEAAELLERLRRMETFAEFMVKESERNWQEAKMRAEEYQQMAERSARHTLLRKEEAANIQRALRDAECFIGRLENK